jgi:hypothetical protein
MLGEALLKMNMIFISNNSQLTYPIFEPLSIARIDSFRNMLKFMRALLKYKKKTVNVFLSKRTLKGQHKCRD